MEIGIVGSDDFVTGFGLSGVRHLYLAKGDLREQVEKALENREIGILVMEDSEFESLDHKTKKAIEKLITPVLVKVSDSGKQTDLTELIKRSIGVDLWK